MKKVKHINYVNRRKKATKQFREIARAAFDTPQGTRVACVAVHDRGEHSISVYMYGPEKEGKRTRLVFGLSPHGAAAFIQAGLHCLAAIHEDSKGWGAKP